MMDLPLVSLPDLPMATRKAPAKKAVTKKTAKRTLDDVKNVTHTKPSRMTTKAEPAIGRIPEHVLLGNVTGLDAKNSPCCQGLADDRKDPACASAVQVERLTYGAQRIVVG